MSSTYIYSNICTLSFSGNSLQTSQSFLVYTRMKPDATVRLYAGQNAVGHEIDSRVQHFLKWGVGGGGGGTSPLCPLIQDQQLSEI